MLKDLKISQQREKRRWFILPIAEQMSHIGGEVLRAIAWKEKGNQNYSHMALDRALELLDLQLQDSRYIHRLK